jgi:hypothetical protein
VTLAVETRCITARILKTLPASLKGGGIFCEAK